MKSTLVSDASPLQGWIPFLEDDDNDSYSHVLPFDVHGTGNHWTTYSQLDKWFDALHPSQHLKSSHSSVDHTAWTPMRHHGRPLLRQTAWVPLSADCTCGYGYSDTWQTPATSPEFRRVLDDLTQHVEEATGVTAFNAVNLNYYPPGAGVGWHADDEFLFDGLQRETCIVSLSLGRGLDDGILAGARKFLVQPKHPHNNTNNNGHHHHKKHELVLKHGDLITMEGMFQKHYVHAIWPGDDYHYNFQDDPYCQGERISLTWRTIVQHLNGQDDAWCRGQTCPLSKTKVSFDATA